MKRQKTNEITMPVLYLVPSPIGNFDDMTYRSVEVLKKVDYIFAEDTRVTKVLLSHFNILTPLQNYHAFNEQTQSGKIIVLMQKGASIAIVSDAGLPGISDPGYLAVRQAINAGFPVVSLPGANAALTALIASGLPCDKFYFHGFLSSKTHQKKKELELLKNIKNVLIFYEAPHRVAETLRLIHEIFGNREIVVARELTKKHEEYIRGMSGDIVSAALELKGEIVIIVRGARIDSNIKELNEGSIQEHYEYYLNVGNTSMDAIKSVAKDRGVAKNDIYNIIKETKRMD